MPAMAKSNQGQIQEIGSQLWFPLMGSGDLPSHLPESPLVLPMVHISGKLEMGVEPGHKSR